MDRITFTVNGNKCFVGSEVSSTTMLLDYLRGSLELRGTKYMCREGGCGACIVAAKLPTHDTPRAVNTCLVAVTSCQDWDITTIEDLGDRRRGYHELQQKLAENNGSQCGYCSPGFIMNMYSLIQNRKSDLTMLEIEKSFSSNICRCTGYRAILDSFKKFGKDYPRTDNIADIEDLVKSCKLSGSECRKDSCTDNEWCLIKSEDIEDDEIKEIKLKDNKKWYRVNTTSEFFDIIKQKGQQSYGLVAGNTAKGVYAIEESPDILIDINGIQRLKGYSIDQNLVLGAGNTLNETIEIFSNVASEEYFGYLNKLHNHLLLVDNLAVRNISTIGGNLMIKKKNNDFPSDLFLLFETIGATVTILNSQGNQQDVTPEQFLSTDMNEKLILNIKLPPLSDKNLMDFYKVMPHSQNAIARVNAGFLYEIRDGKVSKTRIVYGGINAKFVHASKTEKYLLGRELFRNDTLQEALKILEQELVAEDVSEEKTKSKKKIALGLFYKGLLSLIDPKKLNSRYQSGSTKIHEGRGVSTASQDYDTNSALWPLNKPMPKLESLIQCAGEAPYVDDIPSTPKDVFAAFVLSTVPTGAIDHIDSDNALKIDGVISFYVAKDIPGRNSFTSPKLLFTPEYEEILCSGNVKYNGQPIGIIVAESEHIAEKAAKLVNITYKNINPPVISIVDAKKDLDRVTLYKYFPATDKGSNEYKTIKGTNHIQGQYHYHLEKQLCVSRPADDGIEVFPSSEWMDLTQIAMTGALKMQEHSVNQSVRRLGGSFGAKATRAAWIAVACSIVTLKLNRPCRMILPMDTNMKAIGKRLPFSADFEVTVNQSGVIQNLEYSLYEDNGYMVDESFFNLGLPAATNIYDRYRWNLRAFDVVTDTAKNTWMQAPGSFQTIAMIEMIMERLSYELALDPIEVRMSNLTIQNDANTVTDVVETIKTKGNYYERKEAVSKFNEENRWKKRGLRFAPLKWPINIAAYYNVTLSVHHSDATVVITHGGIEVGQGINTKVTQVCASTLNISMNKIKVKATNNLTNINGMTNASSITSEMICYGVIKCCQILLDRLTPVKVTLGDLAWDILILIAYTRGINLVTSYNVNPNDQKFYYVYGASLAEVEVDVLTGESEVLRVDLLQDVGQSISPEIDVGLTEGAFIIGQGFWTSEDLEYDNSTGELLTNRSWNYHVPQACDIPQDFKVYFRKNTYNHDGVLGSKAAGDPASCLSICVPFAIRAALSSSRVDSGKSASDWFALEGAHTIDRIVLAANTRLEEFLFD